MSHINQQTSNLIDDLEYLENTIDFICKICLTLITPSNGIILKNCRHEICKKCIANYIKTSLDVEIKCPIIADDTQQCDKFIQDRELRCFITNAEYLIHLKKSLTLAETSIKNSFHCKTPNCIGWIEIVNQNHLRNFRCVVCNRTNCVKCKSIHEGISCVEFKRMFGHRDENLSKNYIQRMLRERKVMKCPKCGILVQKINGCNHLKCLSCKNEFQWMGISGFEGFR